jgi:hypothetical protein
LDPKFCLLVSVSSLSCKSLMQKSMAPGCHATKFCMVAHNICESSVCNLLHFTSLVIRIWRWCIDYWKNLCTYDLSYDMFEVNEAFLSSYLLDAFCHVYLMQRNKLNFFSYCINVCNIICFYELIWMWLHVSANISHYQIHSIFINSKNSEYNVFKYPGVEPTTKISRGSKNNLS